MPDTNSMALLPSPAPVPSLSITPHIPETTLAQFTIIVVFYFIATAAILLRIYARYMKGSTFFFNDYAVFWGYFWASVSTGAAMALILQGALGHHISVIVELAPERLVTLGKLFLVIQITWAPANAGAKISIIDLYLKIFGTSKKFRICALILAGFVVAYVFLVTFLISFICTPFAFNWDKTIKDGHCANIRADFLATGTVNLVLDIFVIVLPMPILWGLKMRRSKKLGLAFMFSIGFLICAITMWRLIAIQEYNFNDPYFNLGFPILTSALEQLLGITNACLPILVAPFAALRSNFVAWSTRNKSKMAERTTASFKPSAATSHSNTKNFNRLYDHVFPLSKSDVTCDAEQIELQSRLSNHDAREDKIQLTTAWHVQQT